MQNKISDGQTIDWTNNTGADIPSGNPVFIGKLIGVAVGLIKSTEKGVVSIDENVMQWPKHNGLAISQGDKVFWNAAGSEITKTNTDKFVGTAFAGALAGDATVQVIVTDDAPADTAAKSTQAAAVDLASAEALANDLKAKLNALIDVLYNAGIVTGQ